MAMPKAASGPPSSNQAPTLKRLKEPIKILPQRHQALSDQCPPSHCPLVTLTSGVLVPTVCPPGRRCSADKCEGRGGLYYVDTCSDVTALRNTPNVKLGWLSGIVGLVWFGFFSSYAPFFFFFSPSPLFFFFFFFFFGTWEVCEGGEGERIYGWVIIKSRPELGKCWSNNGCRVH